MMLQNVSEVNRERTRIAALSSIHDSTRQNGLVTKGMSTLIIISYQLSTKVFISLTLLFWKSEI